jgi:hypothetical protein
MLHGLLFLLISQEISLVLDLQQLVVPHFCCFKAGTSLLSLQHHLRYVFVENLVGEDELQDYYTVFSLSNLMWCSAESSN